MVSTAGGIVIAIVVILVVAAVGWIVFTQLRARRLGVSLGSPLILCSVACLLVFAHKQLWTSPPSFRELRQSNSKAASD